MRLKNADCILLKNILAFLKASGRGDLAAPLGELLDRFEKDSAATREANRLRSQKNRENGYTWGSAPKPAKSKYYKEDGEK